MDTSTHSQQQENPNNFRSIPKTPEWLSVNFDVLAIAPTQIDRENSILHGFVVAQEGPFKNSWRGEFDAAGLSLIAQMINAKPKGLKSRFTHPTMSDDGLGKLLGRVKNARLDETTTESGKTVACVRADLHFDPTALDTPINGGKPLGVYVMDLAESDPDAISSSLVLKYDEKLRLNEDGTRKTDDDGNYLPPLWVPRELHASDIVDEGDAVDGLLSAFPDRMVYLRASELLNKAFPNQTREVIEARGLSFLHKYLDSKFPSGSKHLAAASEMECPECGALYADGEEYCPHDGTKLKEKNENLQKNKPHGDENMSEKQPVKPASEPKEPEKLSPEQAEIARLREESAKKDEQIAALSSELQTVKPLAEKVDGLLEQVANLNAKNDRMELTSLLDGELFHKWRTDEKEKLTSHLLKLKAVSNELYNEGLEEVRNRADVKPRLSQVAAHITDGATGKPSGNSINELRQNHMAKVADREKLNLKKLADNDKVYAICAKEDPELWDAKKGVSNG